MVTSFSGGGSREYPERTTKHGQATGKLYHMRLRVECTLFCYVHSWVLTHAVMLGSLGALASSTTKTGRHDITERDVFTLLSAVIGLYELLDPARDIGQMHTR
jgi:hypothetical protein